MADLPVLSNMVTRLFESSSHLSDSSVKYLIEALCHLSEERLVNARTMKVKIVSLRSILRRLTVEGEIIYKFFSFHIFALFWCFLGSVVVGERIIYVV